MRLHRLHLERYGGFEDAVLDLPPPEGATDVTIVLGPNEAGKSTAFAAWLDLLYGMKDGRHPAAWRHPRKNLRIGAEVEAGGTTRHLTRLPTRTDALRDGAGSPIAQAELATLLHGLERKAYRNRFSLDRAMLEAGGQQIAKGDGDLGALLFAGVSGLPGIHAAIGEAASAAEAFHKPHGRATTLALAKKELQGLAADLAQPLWILHPIVRMCGSLRQDCCHAKKHRAGHAQVHEE